MSLPEEGIMKMLDEYENDFKTGMDTALIAKEIRNYMQKGTEICLRKQKNIKF